MATRKVFLDTSGFFAWLSADDEQHEQAVEIVAAKTNRFVTADWIVGETVNLLKARKKPHLALRLFELIETTQAIDVVHLDPDRFWKAKAFWIKHGDQPFSFTDCTSFVVMRERRIREALTKDEDFRTAGFVPLLA